MCPMVPFEIDGTRVTPIPYLHGQTDVWGYRIGGIAYCTDCSFIPESSFELLGDLDVLILDAVRIKPHATHFNLEQAIEVARRVGAKHTYFTHIAHEIRHAVIAPTLPDGMGLAYDGLVCASDQPAN
jgi:phosphoribosyl 1,2-cyclic phosphate phosphodiesterase